MTSVPTTLLVGVFTVLASQDLPWRGTVVKPDEPGEPLILSGTVYAPDGRSRVVGARVRIYHTDATGRYSPDGGDESRPRLQIVLQTNAEGRYEVRTIVPAAYPAQRSSPAHIHIMVSIKGGTEQNATVSVAGDPRLTKSDYERHAQAGTFSAIRPIERGADGISRCVRDIRLR